MKLLTFVLISIWGLQVNATDCFLTVTNRNKGEYTTVKLETVKSEIGNGRKPKESRSFRAEAKGFTAFYSVFFRSNTKLLSLANQFMVTSTESDPEIEQNLDLKLDIGETSAHVQCNY